MAEIIFTWDEEKAKRNVKLHKVMFEDAKTVFYDDKAILIDDPDHSEDEERFLIIGTSWSLKTVIVSHCYRRSGEEIRIISARKATKKESKIYVRGLL